MEITVSTGVKFNVKKAPAMAFRAVVKAWDARAPKVPTLFIEDKGRREENPNDPDYLKAVEKFQEDKGIALFDAAILLCTEVRFVPENIETYEGGEWLENLKLIGISPGNEKRDKYLAWVKYYAATNEDDMMLLNKSIARSNWVSEGDIPAAIAGFKSSQERATDRDISPERADRNGDNVPKLAS